MLVTNSLATDSIRAFVQFLRIYVVGDDGYRVPSTEGPAGLSLPLSKKEFGRLKTKGD